MGTSGNPLACGGGRCVVCDTGVAVVFDDDEEKDEDSEVDEVLSGDEEDDDEDLGTEARKGRSLRFGRVVLSALIRFVSL